MLNPIPKEAVNSLGAAHDVLSMDTTMIPGSYGDAIAAAKGLIRAILESQLVVCRNEKDPEESPEQPPSDSE